VGGVAAGTGGGKAFEAQAHPAVAAQAHPAAAAQAHPAAAAQAHPATAAQAHPATAAQAYPAVEAQAYPAVEAQAHPAVDPLPTRGADEPIVGSESTPTRPASDPTVTDTTRPNAVVETITAPTLTIRLVKGRSVSLPVMARGTYPTDSEVITWQASNAHIQVTPPSQIMKGRTDGTFRAPMNRAAVVRIKGSSRGSATLSLTAPGGAKMSVKLRVVADAVKVKSLTITKKRAKMPVGAIITLSAKTKPASATGVVVRWASSKPKVATVDDDGRVTARTTGRTVITGQAGAKKAKYTLTVQ
jgi:hypothetical protein